MHTTSNTAINDPAAPQPPFSLYLLGCALVAALGGLLFGFDTAVISGTVDALRAKFDLSDTCSVSRWRARLLAPSWVPLVPVVPQTSSGGAPHWRRWESSMWCHRSGALSLGTGGRS